jgi:hypothetical protein
VIIAALDIIKGAMDLGNALPSGTTPEGEDAVTELLNLNLLMDDLSENRLFMPTLPQRVIEWPAGASELAVGPGLAVDFENIPVKLWYAQFIWNANSAQGRQNIPIDVVDEEQFKRIVFQDWRFQWPRAVWYEVSSDFDGLATLHVWPVPAQLTTIKIQYQRQLRIFETCSSEMNLPPGWSNYLIYELCSRRYFAWHQENTPQSILKMADKLGRKVGVITHQKSHVVSGLTAIAPRARNRRNGGFPQIYFGPYAGNSGGLI